MIAQFIFFMQNVAYSIVMPLLIIIGFVYVVKKIIRKL